jgi:hypothetical protein
MARHTIPGTGVKKFFSTSDGDSRPKTDQTVYKKDSSGRAMKVKNERYNPSTGQTRKTKPK